MSAQIEEAPGEPQAKPARRGLNREISFGRSKEAPTKPKAAASIGLIIGAEPSVSLLPPEVHALARARTTRNVVFFAIVGVLAIMGLAAAASSVLATNAESRATLKQQEVQSVMLQQGQYTPVLKVQQNVSIAQAAQRAVAAQQIDWKAFFGEITTALPKGIAVGGVTGTVGASSAGQAQTSDALGAAASAATVTMQLSASSPDLVANALDALATVPGVVSVDPAAISGQGGSYATTITLGLSSAAFSPRFQTSGQ